MKAALHSAASLLAATNSIHSTGTLIVLNLIASGLNTPERITHYTKKQTNSTKKILQNLHNTGLIRYSEGSTKSYTLTAKGKSALHHYHTSINTHFNS